MGPHGNVKLIGKKYVTHFDQHENTLKDVIGIYEIEVKKTVAHEEKGDPTSLAFSSFFPTSLWGINSNPAKTTSKCKTTKKKNTPIKLGLDLETDFYGNHVLVKNIDRSSQVAQINCLQVGHVVIAVNGQDVSDLTFQETMKVLKSAKYPRRLRFLDPKVMDVNKVVHENSLLNKDLYGFARPEKYFLKHRQHRRNANDKTYKKEQIWIRFIKEMGGLEGLDYRYNHSRHEERTSLSERMKPLIRLGIPAAFRGAMWKILAGVSAYKKNYPSNYYEEIKSKERTHQAFEDIEKDVCRTYPEHSFFQNETGRNELKHVLFAYSIHNSDIGYCQSMNFIVGMMLLFLSEEDAFWLLCVMMEKSLPSENYVHSMVGTQVDQRVFERLVELELPEINAAFLKSGIQISLITIQWFLCVFVCTLPTDTALRVWDYLFLQGPEVLFNVAIAVLKLSEERIITVKKSAELFGLVRDLGTDLHNAEPLLDLVYSMDDSLNRIGPDDELDFLPVAVEQFMRKHVNISSPLSFSPCRKYRKKFLWVDIQKWREEFRVEIEAALAKKKDEP